MKIPRSLYLFIIFGSLTSCQSSRCDSDEVVCETVHRYGVALEPKDWSARGQYGQVVSMRTDGVAVSRTYEAGVLHGDCTYTFPYSEAVQKKEVYDQGTLTHEFSYYPNHLPWKEVSYQSPSDWSTIAWYESGAPQYREKIENEILTEGEYYNADQQVESRIENSNGFRTHRDSVGQIQSVDKIENGQLIVNTAYHPNGTPAAITPYVNGVIEGERRTYFPGGEPHTLEGWINNQQHGNTVVFEHGEKRADVSYVNGCRQGIERRYRDDQTLVQEVHWEKGQKHGPCYTYVGDNCKTDWYFQNRQVPNKATYEMLCSQ